MNSETPFSRLVRAIRRATGMTQKQMADALDVSFASVNGWENGRHQPMPLLRKQLRRMAINHGIDPDDPGVLAGRDVPPVQPDSHP